MSQLIRECKISLYEQDIMNLLSGCLSLSSSPRFPFSLLNLQFLMVSALAINGEVKLRRRGGTAAISESTLAQEQQEAVLSTGGWKKNQESTSMIGMESSYPQH